MLIPKTVAKADFIAIFCLCLFFLAVKSAPTENGYQFALWRPLLTESGVAGHQLTSCCSDAVVTINLYLQAFYIKSIRNATPMSQ